MFYAKSFISVSSVCTGSGCGLSADNRDSNTQHWHGAKHYPQHTDHQSKYDDIAQHNNYNSGGYEHANHTIYFNYNDLAGIKHNGNPLSHAGDAEYCG